MPSPSSLSRAACPGRMPMSPSLPGISAYSTLTLATSFSGVAISSCKRSAVLFSAMALLHLFGALQHVFDRALHVARLLRHIVVLALDHFFEAAHRIGDLHVLTLTARERFGDAE